jgi:polysaccharide biosynthesis protein PslH
MQRCFASAHTFSSVRVLLLSQLLPWPLDAGPKVRVHYVLRYLAEAGHDVTLVCFVRPDDRPENLERVSRLCRSVHPVLLKRSRLKDVGHALGSLASATPFLIRRDRVPEMSRTVAAVVDQRSWDAVHADQLWMAPYAAACPPGPMKVLDQHNAVFRVPERWAANHPNPVFRPLLRREAKNLERYERETVRSFDRVAWVAAEDQAALAASGTGACQQFVIPIAVDPGENRPVRGSRPFRVTFLGGIHWPPNAEAVRWFAAKVWPAVRAAVPECVFTVIGKGSPGRLPDDARIDVTGYVHDLRARLSETAVFVVPLLTAAGMRVKILDAWCWGLPIVSTSIGAEGTAAASGLNICLADAPEEFAERVIELLRDPSAATRIADNGRATVEAHYDWRKVYRAWDAIYH